jgi:uncharacterized protein (DUF433 family)
MPIRPEDRIVRSRYWVRGKRKQRDEQLKRGTKMPGREDRMDEETRIEVNPRVMLGKPVIRGARIPVELILRKLAEGDSEAELLEAYPRLTREDIRAAIAYAADALAGEERVAITGPRKRSRR